MRTSFVSNKAVLANYARKFVQDGQYFDDDLAKLYLDEGTDRILTSINLKPYIVHIELYNGKGELPRNFKQPLQVAYRGCKDPNQLLRRVSVSQYIAHGYKDGCKLEINVKCKECNELDECGCTKTNLDSSYPIEVPYSESFMRSYPELAEYNRSKFLYDYSNNPLPRDTQGIKSKLHEGFNIIRPTRNYFFNLPKVVQNCQVPCVDNMLEFEIKNKVITVNSDDPQGEILVAYLGYEIDEEGFLMVPDERFVFTALEACIIEGFALREKVIRPTQAARANWKDSMQYATMLVGRAKSKLKIADPDQWEEFLRTIWLRRKPYVNELNKSGKYFNDDVKPHALGYQY